MATMMKPMITPHPGSAFDGGGVGGWTDCSGAGVRGSGAGDDTVAVFDARPAVRGSEWQPHVKAIIAVERRVLTFKPATGLWTSSFECAFYLSNRPIRAGQAADAIRKHWGIENKQHYTRDVTFRENASRIRRARASSQGYAASPTISSASINPTLSPRIDMPQLSVGSKPSAR
jgi:hypothetical protein